MRKTDHPRTIAIGDIHGCAEALEALLALVDPRPADTVVMLGDYVDGGPESRAVIDRLIRLREECQLVTILGNHDEMMLGARYGKDDLNFWCKTGGVTTLASYGTGRDLKAVPWDHWRFLQDCVLHFETPSHFFVHGRYDAAVPLDEQNRKTLLWLSLDEEVPEPHASGKVGVVGHTVQRSGSILDLPHLKCIDTGCGHGGMLTALNVETGLVWQTDEAG